MVRWLTSHTADSDREDFSPTPSRRSAAEASPRPVNAPGLRQDSLDGGEQSLPRSFAVNFSAGFSVVAPLLSLWNVRAAFGPMNDRAFMADHASVPATVVSVSPVTASRSSASSIDVVLAFRQASGEACTSTWHTGIPPFSGAPGDTVMVVPRSASCGLPLIPSSVGDPMQTFALAAALMAGALASTKFWSRLSRRPVARPVAFALVGRRHDVA